MWPSEGAGWVGRWGIKRRGDGDELRPDHAWVCVLLDFVLGECESLRVIGRGKTLSHLCCAKSILISVITYTEVGEGTEAWRPTWQNGFYMQTSVL